MPKKIAYPYRRKKAKRSPESYRGKDATARQRQLENLRLGRQRKRPAVLGEGRIQEADLERLDIIEFTRWVLGISLYPVQEVILRSLYGLHLDAEQLEIYKTLTGNEGEFEAGQEKVEAVLVLGARSGKSFLSSICALYESVCRASRWRAYLNEGEFAYVIVVATRLDQARQIIGKNCDRMLAASRISHLVEESWQTELSLTNGIHIISMPCSSTAGRGLPICCLILDELGWYQQEGPKADEEIFNALRPRMSQFRGAKLFAISTPSAKTGLLWQFYDEGPQVPGRLTVQAPTALVNPTVDAAFLESELKRNPDNYAREFLAQFAESVSAFLPFNKVAEACVLGGDILPDSVHRYYAGVDQSGLSGRDRFALGIAHRVKDEVTIDLVRSWDSTDGRQIMGELRSILRDYGIGSVAIDRYGAGWVRQRFEDIGIEVTIREGLPAIFQNLKSLLLAGCIHIPDTKAVKEGLVRTSAFYGRNGALSISHERTAAGHGDECDALATAAWLASSKTVGGYFSKALEYQRSLIGAANG